MVSWPCLFSGVVVILLSLMKYIVFLQITRQQPAQSPCRDEFSVPHDLLSLAIGILNSNIQLAKQVPGVDAIEFDENTATFIITGEVCIHSVSIYKFLVQASHVCKMHDLTVVCVG